MNHITWLVAIAIGLVVVAALLRLTQNGSARRMRLRRTALLFVPYVLLAACATFGVTPRTPPAPQVGSASAAASSRWKQGRQSPWLTAKRSPLQGQTPKEITSPQPRHLRST